MDRRAARKKRRQDQAREEILQAARRVLLAKGLAGMTLSAVGRELQLTKAALYYYFPSKEALVFELIYLGLKGHAELVEAAIAKTTSGSEALEALIRSSAEHYGDHRDDLRLAYLVPQITSAGTAQLSPEALTRIRPFNELLYGSVAKKIAADQASGRVPSDIDGRRLAFVAHMSVIGVLTVEGLVERADDAPLIHSRNAMVDELVAAFTGRLAMGS